MNKIIIAAGGTGGHLFPAIAIADELRKINRDTDIQFLGAKGKIEEKVVPKKGYKLKTIEIAGLKRSLSPKNLGMFIKLKRAIKETKKYLSEQKPELVFGTGGFVSGPALWASTKMGIPSVIQEGNYYPGITVKLLARKLDKVIVNFNGTKKFLKRQDNIELMPYPVRENLIKYSREEACRYFKLDSGKKVLFVLGGSQGAHSINRVLTDNIIMIFKQNIQLIWQTGESDFDRIIANINGLSGIKAMKFIDDVDYAYSAADLVLCRSGISTAMELAYFGAAALFVPYPFASENHQEKNARAIVEKNAAEMILDKDLDSAMTGKILDLIHDDTRLSVLRANISEISDKNAANKIARLLIDLADKNKN
jgi:UDP-N-acetylglucosamine--N-acetylmuramyl-(pentapeptide) pyrophosphoryl-undecaprenol N-acetylglucosamine transferase